MRLVAKMGVLGAAGAPGPPDVGWPGGYPTHATEIRLRTAVLFYFFRMIPPPPRSTLFPYTTLFRSPTVGIPLPFFSYGGSGLWGFTILLFIFVKLDAANYHYT